MTNKPVTLNPVGFREEPDSPKHRGFEDNLRNRLISMAGSGEVDLRPYSSPRHDQATTSSCVAQATVKALEIKRILQHGHEAHIDLSRMAVYWMARNLMFPKETHLDSGTYISMAFDVLRKFGVPPEEAFPWDERRIFDAPTWNAMRQAYVSKIEAFYKIRSTGLDRIDMVIEALQAGHPVVYGTNVGSNWMNYRKGQVIHPTPKEEILGRHATVLVGFTNGKIIGENSWGCYDKETEILTSAGWRRFYHLKGSEKFATLNPRTHECEYQHATKVHDYDYHGDLIHFQSPGVDLLVTPNHRMYLTDGPETLPQWPILQADTVSGRQRFKKNAINETPDRLHFDAAGDLDPDDWLYFLGQLLAEGGSQVTLELPDESAIAVARTIGKDSERHIPREYLQLSFRQSRILLNAIMKVAEPNLGVYCTKSPQLANDLQELAFRSEYAADIHISLHDGQPTYQVELRKVQLCPMARHDPKKVRYKGRVYCVTVPNGLVYVRRRGKAVWSGNSHWGDDGFYLMDSAVISDPGSADFWVPQAGWEPYKSP